MWWLRWNNFFAGENRELYGFKEFKNERKIDKLIENLKKNVIFLKKTERFGQLCTIAGENWHLIKFQ